MALRKEGSGVVLDCQLPHLISLDEDLLSSGIILYYLKVNTESKFNDSHIAVFLKSLPAKVHRFC